MDAAATIDIPMAYRGHFLPAGPSTTEACEDEYLLTVRLRQWWRHGRQTRQASLEVFMVRG
jgi:hypothetical protein